MKATTALLALNGLFRGRVRVRRCRACDHASLFVGLGPADEVWGCVRCHSNRRYELVALALERLRPSLRRGALVVDTDFRSPLSARLRSWGDAIRYLQTAFVPGEPFGATLVDPKYGGAWNEDLTSLSMASSTVELLIACDVFEHIDQLPVALNEVARVLTPSGSCLFTVPTFSVSGRSISEIRTRPNRGASHRVADIVDGTLRFVSEPEYHLDPHSVDGIPVFWRFGDDICQFIGAMCDLDVKVIEGPEGSDRRSVYLATHRGVAPIG